MRKIIISFFLIFVFANCNAQNGANQSGTGSNMHSPVSVDKNTVTAPEINIVQVTATAVPFSQKESIIHSYPGYHTSTSLGNTHQVAVEKSVTAERADGVKVTSQKRSVTESHAENKLLLPEIEINQKAEKR